MTAGTVRIGIVGTTDYAQTHLTRIAAHPRAVLTAITGRDSIRAHRVADEHGIAHVHSDYRDMIAAGQIDAVVIVAPDELHAPIALAAFDSGLHVLCEKPLAGTAADAERMYRAATRSGLVNMSFFALRTLPHHRYLKQLIEDGYVGRVYDAEFSLTHGFFRGPDYQWRFDARRGTGALGDLGCYLFDLARWYIGDITAVSASTRSHVDRIAAHGKSFAAANDSAVIAVEFVGGAHATMLASVTSYQADRLQANSIRIYGEHGTLELDHTFAGARIRGARAGDATFAELALPPELEEATDGRATAAAAAVGDHAFIDAILTGSSVEPEFFDGWRVQQMIEASLESADTRRWTTVGEARK